MDTIGTPTLWTVTLVAVVALLALDFALTRKPHEVSMREAVGWSAFYVALPLAFGVYVWSAHGGRTGLGYYTGYLVEKSLSVDNLFVFMLLLGAFAVPARSSSVSCSSASSGRWSCAASSSPWARPRWTPSTGCSWSSA